MTTPTLRTAAEATHPTLPARKVNYGFWVWVGCSLLLTLGVTVVVTAGLVRKVLINDNHIPERIASIILNTSEILPKIALAIIEIPNILSEEPRGLLFQKNETETKYWTRKFPASEDSGYLLLSGAKNNEKQNAVYLIRISDGTLLAKWVPDWEYIYGQITSKNGAIRPSRYNLLQAINPLLLNNGDIVFNTHGAMVRMGTCSAKPIWILDEPIHHTNELGQDNTIWSPSISTDGLSTNSWLKRRLVDDSIAHISADGRLLKNLSFSDILIRNNLQALLLGSFGKRINVDPIHMNKISEATISTKHWEKGDLLISARHLSAVFLYRPSSDKIIWYKVGPWMNQHSAEFVGDHKISVLSNNALSMAPSKYSFIKENDINRVFIYDFSTQTFDEPYRELLELARPKALSGGVAKILPDGGLFFEETDSGRHLRFSKEKLIWSRVNDYDSKSIGSVAFSRYLDGETAIKSIEAIQKVQCNIK